MGVRRFNLIIISFRFKFQFCTNYEFRSNEKLDVLNPDSGQTGNDLKIQCVDVGYYHTACIDEHGRVWTWGDNRYGQLGDKEDLLNHGIPRIVKGGLESMIFLSF